MTARATLAAMHAECICEARDLEAIAARRDPDSADAMQARDYAAMLRDRAAALASALDVMGGVYIAPPGQLALFSDGGPQ
jgi:hypothetical protein